MNHNKAVLLSAPVSKESIDNISLYDAAYISGIVYTMMYPHHYQNYMDSVIKGITPPFDLKNGIIYHTGAIIEKNESGVRTVKAIGTTTSSKFNEYMPDFIRLSGIRIIIGKGGMDKATLSAMEKYGCIYLTAMGGCSALYTPGVVSLEDEYYPGKSWADSVLKLKLNGFGPLYAAMDNKGHSLYERG